MAHPPRVVWWVGISSALADATATSLTAEIIAGSLLITAGRAAGGAEDCAIAVCGSGFCAAGICGAGASIGAAAANVSASASSEGVASATATLGAGSGAGAVFAAGAFLGGTSFTTTV